MNWYIVEKEHVKYLHSIDKKVEHIEYNERIKPYIGIILEIHEFKYYVPISSVKEKYYHMKNSMDLYKIVSKDKILGVLNLNNMIPIKYEYIKRLEYKNIEEYRKFNSETEKVKFIKLLSKELKIINNSKMEIISKANELYEHIQKHPKSKIAERSCNFKLLEEKINNILV